MLKTEIYMSVSLTEHYTQNLKTSSFVRSDQNDNHFKVHKHLLFARGGVHKKYSGLN